MGRAGLRGGAAVKDIPRLSWAEPPALVLYPTMGTRSVARGAGAASQPRVARPGGGGGTTPEKMK